MSPSCFSVAAPPKTQPATSLSELMQEEAMNWITRERIRVGRIGCAWLIRRFIDPQAVFYFVSGAQLQPEAARLEATIFHEAGAGLAREGEVSSFEMVMRHYD